MPILRIATIPEPVLKTPARQVGDLNADLARFLDDLVETMRSFPRCVGLAAPQVFKPLRVIAVDVSLSGKPHPNHGQLVLLNPVIKAAEGKKTGREGCLSIPDLTANVARAEKVRVEGLSPDGKAITLETEGFEAIVLQHEIDHLNGLLFLDRVTSLKTDVFRRKVYLDNPSRKG